MRSLEVGAPVFFVVLIALLLGMALVAEKNNHEREMEKLRVIMDCKQLAA